MFGRLKALGSEIAPRIHAWTADRAADQSEGERLLEEGSFEAAELHLSRAVLDAEKKRHLPRNRIQLRLQLAEAQRRQYNPEEEHPNKSKLDAAAESARSALELALRSADNALHVECLDMLVAVLSDRGDCAEVEQYAEQATQTESAIAKPDPKQKVRRLVRVASVRRRVGRVSDAVVAYTEALALTETIYGEKHVETAAVLTELGDAHRFLGAYHKAEEYLAQALRIHEIERGSDAPETLHDLHLFTASCEASGNIQAAATQHERRLGLRLRVMGVDLMEIAARQMELADHYMRWGNTSRARELVLEATGTLRRERGPRLARAYEALATIEESIGRYTEAVHEFERASVIWESMPGPDCSNLARNLQCRAQLFDRLRLPRDAAFLREKLKALALSGRLAAAG